MAHITGLTISHMMGAEEEDYLNRRQSIQVRALVTPVVVKKEVFNKAFGRFFFHEVQGMCVLLG